MKHSEYNIEYVFQAKQKILNLSVFNMISQLNE